MKEKEELQTRWIVTDVEDSYSVKWIKTMKEIYPMFKNNKFIFIVVGGNGRMEINTNDMTRVEKCAKMMSYPKGRAAVTSDTVRIFVRQQDESEVLMGFLKHERAKTFAPIIERIKDRD